MEKWRIGVKKPDMEERVTIDVGGMVFATSLSTLRRHPESFFGGLLRFGGGDPPPKHVFIDRSPACFGLVLDHLRGEPLPVALLSERDVWHLRRDAAFFGLPELAAALEEEHWTWDASGGAQMRHDQGEEEAGEDIEVEAAGSGALRGEQHAWHVRLDTGGLGVSLGVCGEHGAVLKLGCFGGVLFGKGLPRTGQEYDLAVPRGGLPPGTVVSVELRPRAGWIRFAVGLRRGRRVPLPPGEAGWRPYVRLVHPGDCVTRVPAPDAGK